MVSMDRDFVSEWLNLDRELLFFFGRHAGLYVGAGSALTSRVLRLTNSSADWTSPRDVCGGSLSSGNDHFCSYRLGRG